MDESKDPSSPTSPQPQLAQQSQEQQQQLFSVSSGQHHQEGSEEVAQHEGTIAGLGEEQLQEETSQLMADPLT